MGTGPARGTTRPPSLSLLLPLLVLVSGCAGEPQAAGAPLPVELVSRVDESVVASFELRTRDGAAFWNHTLQLPAQGARGFRTPDIPLGTYEVHVDIGGRQRSALIEWDGGPGLRFVVEAQRIGVQSR